MEQRGYKVALKKPSKEKKTGTVLQKQASLGEMHIHQQGIASIVGQVVSGIKGIALTSSGWRDGLANVLSRSRHDKGISIIEKERSLVMNIHIHAEYGIHIPDAIRRLQEQVVARVKELTDLDVEQVHVHIQNIVVPEGSIYTQEHR